MSLKKITSLLFVLVLLALSPINSFSVSAQDAPAGVRAIDGIAVQPAQSDPSQSLTRAWFIQNLKPGESVERTALVSNLSDKEKTILLSPEDRIKNTDQFTFSDKEELKDVGTWITISSDRVTIPAQKAVEVKFTIKVPANTPSGEYAGVLAVQEIKPNTGASGFNVINRVGARIYISVPGDLKTGIELPQFEFNQPNSAGYNDFVKSNFMQPYDTVFLGMTIKNTGNVFTKVKGTIDIETPTGKVTSEFDRDFASQDNPIAIPAFVTKAKWTVGKYKATFNFTNPAIINFNKENLQDVSPTKTYTTEFNLTEADLAKIKSDFETTKANRPKSNTPVQNANNTPNNNEANNIKEAVVEEKKEEPANNNALFIGLGIGGGIIILGLIGVIGYLVWKQQKDAKAINKTEVKPQEEVKLNKPTKK
jgi:Bacterial protein of unknown function (DUF916)